MCQRLHGDDELVATSNDYVVVVEAYEFVVIEAGLAAPSGQRDGRARVAASVLACSAKLCGQRDAWARSYSRNGALRTTRPGRGRD